MEEEMSGSEDAVTPAAETPEAARRGRGRPRKQVQEPVDPAAPKRPRGRPRGSKNKSQNKATAKEPPKEKRPRGRPRKWPQKVCELQVEEEEAAAQTKNQPPLPSPQEESE